MQVQDKINRHLTVTVSTVKPNAVPADAPGGEEPSYLLEFGLPTNCEGHVLDRIPVSHEDVPLLIQVLRRMHDTMEILRPLWTSPDKDQ